MIEEEKEEKCSEHKEMYREFLKNFHEPTKNPTIIIPDNFKTK